MGGMGVAHVDFAARNCPNLEATPLNQMMRTYFEAKNSDDFGKGYLRGSLDMMNWLKDNATGTCRTALRLYGPASGPNPALMEVK